MKWTTADMPSLKGKIAVVTGANSGLGLHTAIGLAKAGAEVVMACRSPDKAAKALAEVRAQAPGAKVAGMAGQVMAGVGPVPLKAVSLMLGVLRVTVPELVTVTL